MTALCPCGTGKAYTDCCEPFIKGKKKPAIAEDLLRSRYTAFARAEVSYIVETTHPKSRHTVNEQEIRRWATTSQWEKLEIVGQEEIDGRVEIEFVATYTQKGNHNRHHEIAIFSKDGGRWYFEDGRAAPQEQVRHETPKAGRNDPCPCGSGKKFKKCCGGA